MFSSKHRFEFDSVLEPVTAHLVGSVQNQKYDYYFFWKDVDVHFRNEHFIAV